MIVTGPLSMNLNSDIANELANGETNGIGMRVIDVGERGQFTHKWTLLDDEKELYEHAMKRCIRQSAIDEDDDDESNDGNDNDEEKRSKKNLVFDPVVTSQQDDDGDGKGRTRNGSTFDQVELSPLELDRWHSTSGDEEDYQK